MIELILGAAFFALASYAGVLLAAAISAAPFDDGPPPAEPPVPWLIAGAAVIGALLCGRAAAPQQIVVGGMIVCALAAIWCTDMRYGIVPDVFTLAPLALVIGIGLVHREPWPVLSACVAFVPFAGLALVSNGRGMGWGDVKLAALGGAVLGFQIALLAFAGSAVVAVVIAFACGRRRQLIAFAPYLAGAIALALPLAPS